MTTIEHASGGVLVIGAGIAGLWTALVLAPRPVTVVTAGRIGDGSSSWAQGGMAAALGDGDSPDLHTEDTLAAGGGLAQSDAVRFLCSAGPRAVADLLELGVPFDRDAEGQLRLGKEAAHRQNRIVHIGGDEAGAAIMRTLVKAAQRADHIDIREEKVAEKLLVSEGRIAGAQLWDIRSQSLASMTAQSVVLATGGIGGLYAVTTNPLTSQGLGLALAAEAGATLRDLEFVQFHPTALHVGKDPAPLATEAIRGAGGLLRDGEGERFMVALHPDGELAPRDVVARGVAGAIKQTGNAFLDVRGALGRDFATSFPTVHRACQEAGFDPEADLLPVAPAVHYHMGGIRTDLYGRTDVKGLFAVGECASTGVHGANRLASNSLLEAIVFGSAVAEAISDEPVGVPLKVETGPTTLSHGPPTKLGGLRQRMADQAGILRDGLSLKGALEATRTEMASTEGGRLARLSASMVLASAAFREESRGAHQRLDHPQTTTPQHTLLRLQNQDFQLSNEDYPG